MAFIWVQYYGFGPLPTIFEHPMGDVTPSAEPSSNARLDLDSSSSQGQQVQSLSQQQQRQSPNHQVNMTVQQPQMPFNMAALGVALPNLSYGQSFPQQGQHSQQQFTSAITPSAVAYHMGQAPQFGGQQAMNQSSNPAYTMQQFQTYQNPYPPHMAQSSLQPMHQGSSPNQHYFPNSGFMPQQQSPQASQFYYPQGQFPQQHGQAYQISPQQYDRSGTAHHSMAQNARRSNEHLNIATSASPANRSSSSGLSLRAKNIRFC